MQVVYDICTSLEYHPELIFHMFNNCMSTMIFRWNCIAPTAKLTVDYVVVLFNMVKKQSNVTNVKCGFTINALSSQNLNLILLKTQIAPGFVQNVSFFFNFSDSFFADQSNLGNQNRSDPLAMVVGQNPLKLGQIKTNLSVD